VRPGGQTFFDERTSAVRAAVEHAYDACLFVLLCLHSPSVGAFHRPQETGETPFVFVEGATAEQASTLAAQAVENSLARRLVEILLQNANELRITNACGLELRLQLFDIRGRRFCLG
jgi:hypothetical protein